LEVLIGQPNFLLLRLGRFERQHPRADRNPRRDVSDDAHLFFLSFLN
jgi:hypothetical protein